MTRLYSSGSISRDRDFLKRAEEEGRAILSKSSGYIHAISIDNLFDLTKEKDLLLRLSQRPGILWRKARPWDGLPPEKANDDIIERIRNAYYFGRGRTPTQDIEYSIDQLVEVAVRALSPGTNDPFTAVTCVDWLGAALIDVAGRAIPSGWRYDEEHWLRIITHSTDFAGIAAAALNQIRQYGSESVSVVAACWKCWRK